MRTDRRERPAAKNSRDDITADDDAPGTPRHVFGSTLESVQTKQSNQTNAMRQAENVERTDPVGENELARKSLWSQQIV